MPPVIPGVHSRGPAAVDAIADPGSYRRNTNPQAQARTALAYGAKNHIPQRMPAHPTPVLRHAPLDATGVGYTIVERIRRNQTRAHIQSAMRTAGHVEKQRKEGYLSLTRENARPSAIQ